jgi:hypothetical protein
MGFPLSTQSLMIMVGRIVSIEALHGTLDLVNVNGYTNFTNWRRPTLGVPDHRVIIDGLIMPTTKPLIL